jgi:hypothetical protein
MLERDVNVAGDFAAACDGLDQPIRPVRRMGVEQTDPEISFDRVQFFEQVRKSECPHRE